MIAHLPRTLVERVDRCTTIRYAMMLTSDLGNVTAERPDMSYEDAAWWCTQAARVAQETDNECERRVRILMRSCVDPVTLHCAAKGRA